MPADRTAHSLFLSYSSKHRDLARSLADTLEAQYGAGSVWWDHALESWGDYEIQIRNALNQARVVVVLWSASAAASDWVKSEAGRANRDHKLVNVRTPDTSWRDVPSPYDQHHVSELHDTPGILRSIDAVWTGRTVRTAVPLHEIYFRQHGQRLIDPKQRTLPPNPRDISPSELLQARYEVVGYIDVSDVQTQFFDWCTQPGRAAAGRLIYGPGGLGKTRLMVSLAARLRGQGWTAGFLDRPRDSSEPALKQRWQAIEQLIHHGGDSGLLIVVDYAEARQEEVRALARCLCERPDADAEKRPVRLVLLARSAGEWWTTLHADTPDIQRVFRSDDPASAIELPAVSSGALRLALFEASLAAFRRRLDVQQSANVTQPGTPSKAYLTQIETDPEFSRPLAIQMAALVWLTSARSAADASSVEELLRRVLGLERDHWRKILGDLDDENRRDLARAVAQIALVGGPVTVESAERLLMADEFYRGRRTARVDVDRVRRQLSTLYSGPKGVIVPLEPDLIAEHHIASVGDKELIDGYVQWVESEPRENADPCRRSVLTVLHRATQAEHGPQVRAQAVDLLEHIVERHAVALAASIVAVTVNEPGALVSILDRSVDRLAPEAIEALHGALPELSVALRAISLKIVERHVVLAREQLSAVSREQDASSTAKAESILATCLNNLGIRLANLERREEALAPSEEAVAICRRLAAARPEAFRPNLAHSLHNWGIQLKNLGRHEDGLAASEEAVAIYRQLTAAHPTTVLPDLARCLSNMGIQLSKLGRHDEALAWSQEAVEIYRRLAEGRPDTFLPVLAKGLNSLCVRLSNLERHEEALVASEEAVAIQRRLAQTHSDASLPDLSGYLYNLGSRLSSLGRHEEALVASQEAVAVGRLLARALPDVFLPALAKCLSVQSDIFQALGRHASAAQAAQQALEVLAPFVERQPDAFGKLAHVIVLDLLNYSKAASETPDLVLIERVQRALGDAKP